MSSSHCFWNRMCLTVQLSVIIGLLNVSNRQELKTLFYGFFSSFLHFNERSLLSLLKILELHLHLKVFYISPIWQMGSDILWSQTSILAMARPGQPWSNSVCLYVSGKHQIYKYTASFPLLLFIAYHYYTAR